MQMKRMGLSQRRYKTFSGKHPHSHAREIAMQILYQYLIDSNSPSAPVPKGKLAFPFKEIIWESGKLLPMLPPQEDHEPSAPSAPAGNAGVFTQREQLEQPEAGSPKEKLLPTDAEKLQKALEFHWLNQKPRADVADYVTLLVTAVMKYQEKNIAIVKKYSEKDWSQISFSVRAILHLGLTELQWSTPAIIVDDLLNLVRKYDGDESVSFVNGVLGQHARDRK